DGMSLTFTSAPLPDPLEILGFPDVELTLRSDRRNALVCVRLCEVFPDGTSSLVTRALLNLTHRDSDEHPAPLVPGDRAARRDRARVRRGQPAAGGHLADVLAVGVAVTRAGDTDGGCGRELA